MPLVAVSQRHFAAALWLGKVGGICGRRSGCRPPGPRKRQKLAKSAIFRKSRFSPLAMPRAPGGWSRLLRRCFRACRRSLQRALQLFALRSRFFRDFSLRGGQEPGIWRPETGQIGQNRGGFGRREQFLRFFAAVAAWRPQLASCVGALSSCRVPGRFCGARGAASHEFRCADGIWRPRQAAAPAGGPQGL